MTPARKMGLKVGDKVRVMGSKWHWFSVGEEIILAYDDGTNMPYFSGGSKYQYVPLSEVELINAPTKVTGPATITVASGETITVAAGETITFEGNATVKKDWAPKFGIVWFLLIRRKIWLGILGL